MNMERNSITIISLILLSIVSDSFSRISELSELSEQKQQRSCRTLSQQRQGFILSLSWPPSYCMDGPKDECSGPSRWIVHGFWPVAMSLFNNRPNNDRLEFCCSKQKFDKKQFQSIIGYMKENWPPESYTDAYEYYSDQWLQYGSCSHDPTGISSRKRLSSSSIKYEQMNPAEYFALALDLYRRLPIQEWLEKEKIQPSNQKPLKRNKIEQIINSYIGHSKYYQLKCYHKTNTNNNNNNYNQSRQRKQPTATTVANIWNEIRFCFNDRLNLEDCKMFLYSLNNTNKSHKQNENCSSDQLFWVIK